MCLHPLLLIVDAPVHTRQQHCPAHVPLQANLAVWAPTSTQSGSTASLLQVQISNLLTCLACLVLHTVHIGAVV